MGKFKSLEMVLIPCTGFDPLYCCVANRKVSDHLNIPPQHCLITLLSDIERVINEVKDLKRASPNLRKWFGFFKSTVKVLKCFNWIVTILRTSIIEQNQSGRTLNVVGVCTLSLVKISLKPEFKCSFLISQNYGTRGTPWWSLSHRFILHSIPALPKHEVPIAPTSVYVI